MTKDYWANTEEVTPTKCMVAKITVTKKNMFKAIESEGQYLCDTKEIVSGEDFYKQVSSPFFRYIYEEIEKERENENGKNENE